MNYRAVTPLVILLWALGLPHLSRAAANGPYVGGQLGWADTHQGEFISIHLNGLVQKVIPDLSSQPLDILFNNTGVAGRVFVGYQFIRYFAAEVGYYRFSKLDVKTDANLELRIFNSYHLPLNVSTHSKVRTYAIDLIAKGIWPITDRFNVYAKLGLAYLNVSGSVTAAAKTTIVNSIEIIASISANPSLNIVYPAFGFGISYDVSNHFTAELFYSRIQQFDKKLFPNIDFLGVGLAYRFD